VWLNPKKYLLQKMDGVETFLKREEECDSNEEGGTSDSHSPTLPRKAVTFSSDCSEPKFAGRNGSRTRKLGNLSLSYRTRKRQWGNFKSSESSSEGESGDLSTCSESWGEAWSAVNEHKVKEITLNFFYQPRTVTLLLAIVLALVVTAFYRDEHLSRTSNITKGLYASGFLFLSIGLLVFPNGPYTRPHPALWRLVFGLSVIYLLFLSFILFQSYDDVRLLLHYIDEGLNQSTTDSSEIYVDDCSFTWSNLYRRMDIFIPSHFIGWVVKALLVRHMGILWLISVTWELTEIFFAHVLPNFSECWWDIILYDILIGNGLGIYVGMVLCRSLEVRQFHWQSIKDIKGTKGKLKRAVLQFTPEDWSKVRWLDPRSPKMRIMAIFTLVLLFQVVELNTFLLKHIFLIPTSHFLTGGRLVLITLVAAPTMRQYYLFVTDRTCKRIGTQAWVYIAIAITELLISIRFGAPKLPRPALLKVVSWLVIMAALSLLVVLLMLKTGLRKSLFSWFHWSALSPSSTIRKCRRKKGKK